METVNKNFSQTISLAINLTFFTVRTRVKENLRKHLIKSTTAQESISGGTEQLPTEWHRKT